MFFSKIRKTIYLSSAALLSLGLGACVADNYGDLESDAVAGQTVLTPGTYYTLFDLEPITNGGDGTRADFVDGDDGEHSIGSTNNYVIFFDKDQKLKEVIKLVSIDDHDDPWCEKVKETGIETRYAAKINVDEDYVAPSFCLVILNAGEYAETLEDYKLKLTNVNEVDRPQVYMGNIQGWEWSNRSNPKKVGRDGEYFTMTNSVYVKDGGVTIDGVNVPVNCIQKETDEPDPNRSIHIHVERMVSKFSFDYAGSRAGEGYGAVFQPEGARKNIIVFKGTFDKDGIPEYIFDRYQWQARITGWGINALERQSRLFKKVTNGASYYNNWPMSEWNDAAHFRSYWTEDSHYFKDDGGVYPLQFRKAVDYQLKSYNEAYKSMADNTNTLLNYSFDQFIAQNNFETGPVYVPENTYDYKNIYTSLDNRADVLAGSHLIVCAELQTNISGEMKSASIYRDRDRFFYETPREVFIAHIAKLNYLLSSQSEMKFKHYYWDLDKAGYADGIRYDGEELVADVKGNYGVFYRANPAVTTNDVELVACKEDAETQNYMLLSDFNLPSGQYLFDATIKDGDGRMFINLENIVIKEKTTNASFKIYNLAVWEDAKEFNLNRGKGVPERVPTAMRSQPDDDDIKSIVFEWIGPTGFFNEGRMYYFQAPNVTGSVFGTVRNAWYQYNLRAVNFIGSPVSHPEIPIVPIEVENHDQMFDIRIDLLPWHTVLDADVNVLN